MATTRTDLEREAKRRYLAAKKRRIAAQEAAEQPRRDDLAFHAHSARLWAQHQAAQAEAECQRNWWPAYRDRADPRWGVEIDFSDGDVRPLIRAGHRSAWSDKVVWADGVLFPSV